VKAPAAISQSMFRWPHGIKMQMPIHEVLIYPVAGTDMNTASYQENENAKPLNKAMMS
jgi:hypothetical protein